MAKNFINNYGIEIRKACMSCNFCVISANDVARGKNADVRLCACPHVARKSVSRNDICGCWVPKDCYKEAGNRDGVSGRVKIRKYIDFVRNNFSEVLRESIDGSGTRMVGAIHDILRKKFELQYGINCYGERVE